MAVLNLEWTSQSADVMVTIEGGNMLYSNDAGSIWRQLRPGVNVCLAVNPSGASGPGQYILKEEVGCTVTKCGFNDIATSFLLDGDMQVEGGTLETMNQMFHNCYGLLTLDVSTLNTEFVTDMLSTFYNCNQVPVIDVTNFDTRNVTTMRNMFNECQALTTIDLSGINFNTTNVTDMLGMFAGCDALTALDCSTFNTVNVTNMSAMFSDCINLTAIDVSMFNTSQVTIMAQMFSGCSSLPGIDISSFDTNQTTVMTNMFWGCSSLLCISNLNTTGATSGRGGIFTGCSVLVLPDAAAQLALTTPTVGAGGTVWQNVAACPPPAIPLTIHWDSQSNDTSVEIENADMEFTNDGGVTWSVLTPGTHMLTSGFGYYELKEMLPGSVSRCAFKDPSCSSNFDGGMSAVGGAIRSAEAMFFECSELLTLDVTNLSTEYCENFKDMFSNCRLVPDIDVSNFETTLVTDMSGMFNGCAEVLSLDLIGFDTSNIADLSSMFAGCTAMTTIDLSSFDTTACIDASYMFWACHSLPTIDISTFDASICLDTTQMFSQCSSLTHLDLTSFLTDNVQDLKAMFWNSKALVCITNLDSSAANNPGGRDSIFFGCNALVEPDVAGIAAIEGGTPWVNPGVCP